ncbi:MAG: M24 family metallopeptidase, partial [Pirellulaceae bacterium]
PWDGRESREEQFMANVAGSVPDAVIRDVVPLLDELRGCKSRQEIELMRIAGKLSAQAVTEAMRCTVPGCWEYQLASVAEYVFRVNGADGGAYRPIVAGGENIWNAHYYRNHCQLAEGDLVLMDYAPDYQYYTSDIGRMWPVSGKYSPQQRELYGYIVNYHKTLLGLIRPGVMAEDVENEAAEIMRPIVEQTVWSQDSFCKGAEATLEFRGHLSHGVGMAVHDVWNYRQEPLKPGVVLALDPQMWIQEQEIYIRVEDTVVVTEDGVENLTADAPLELDHVESVIQEHGMLQKFPPIV